MTAGSFCSGTTVSVGFFSDTKTSLGSCFFDSGSLLGSIAPPRDVPGGGAGVAVSVYFLA